MQKNNYTFIKRLLENYHLDKNSITQIPNRKGFGEGLLLAGKNNSKVVALSADLTESTQVELFKKTYPNRFFEMGVAEQNMASVASGMAASGLIPFITSYAMFSPGRNWEQIRTTIAYNNVPVKIIGCHAGVSVGPDGGTHQALEDIAIMRVVPNMIVIVPCDAIEAKKATLAIAENGKPSYMRLSREKSAVVTNEESEFEIGKANLIYESVFQEKNSSSGEINIYTPSAESFSFKTQNKKVGIIACGEMVSRALFCVKELESLGIEVGVMNLHTIKPIDQKGIAEFVNKYKNILTCEEHQVAGGMGSAVLECLAQTNILKGVDLKMLGVADRFGQSGTKEELFTEYELDEKAIIKKVKEFFVTENL
jgi:transketolase